MKLTRNDFSANGIFSSLVLDNGEELSTLEHAYSQSDGSYLPKILNGKYTCIRGTHCLHNGIPFETFEVQNVPGCTGILLHVGNYQNDSEGCCLLGMTRMGDMITSSKVAFNKFMCSLDGLDSFELEVV